ncbi:MAG TPA: molybdopterin-dependent oxidoreductase [Xanthobacteraceae bacterium]|nr:molybdopterin-dependent oxidoreductase [Xanthobacteraceae bacterium]
MARLRAGIRGVDARLLARDAAKLLPDPARRRFLRGGASIGALALLTGCDIIDGPSAENALRIVSRFNDRVQALLFDPDRLAPTYPESAITRPFPFNAYYKEEDAPDIDEDNYKLLVEGLVDDKRSWTLERLYALPQETQITRLVCVEGWSAIGKWTGTPLREFLRRIGADTRARYVHFACAEGYSGSIDMATALHPQTQLTFRYDGEILPAKYGFPLRVRIPTKLGFKNPKHVIGLTVLDHYTGGYWEDQGYNWFSGL